jgi:hypothetical protein
MQKAIDKSKKECYTNSIFKEGETSQCSVLFLHPHITTFIIITQSNIIKVIFAVQNKIARDCFIRLFGTLAVKSLQRVRFLFSKTELAERKTKQ